MKTNRHLSLPAPMEMPRMFGRAASQYMLRMPKQKAPTSREVGASTSVVRLRACGLAGARGRGSAPTSEKTASNASGRYPDLRFVGLRRLPGLCAIADCGLRQLRLRNYNPHLAERTAFSMHKAYQWHNAAASPLTVAWPWGTFTLSSLRTRALDSDAYVKVRRHSVGRIALRLSEPQG